MAERREILNYVTAKLAEAPVLAREKTQEENQSLGYRRGFFRLKKYASDFLLGEKLGNIENRIIVLPGLRGVGKTTTALQIYKYLTLSKNIEQERVLYFSADELKDYLGAKISEVIKVYVEDILKTSLVNLDKEIFILIDEAHFDKDWSTSSKVVYDQTKRAFILLTGSSALSMEMGIDLARRAKKEIMFPLNFSEYLILRHNIFPPKSTAESIRELIFNPSGDSLKYAAGKWDKIKRKTLALGRPIEKQFEYFMTSSGFPFSMKLNEKNAYERIFGMIDRVVERDMFTIKSFNTGTRNIITRILYYLALQKPGGTSDVKLAERTGTSSKLVRDILDVLEKTHLVFSIKPYGGAGKVVRKPWKYYFLSPCINAAIRFKLGVYDMKNRDMLGLFAESLVASYFLRMKETVNLPTGIFYDPSEGGVDFLMQRGIDEIIPVEVSIGKKGKGQVLKAIIKYKSKHGIVISNVDRISFENNVVNIPITLFSFV